MKMNEYLGAGLPVVSTKFEAIHNTPEKQQARLALAGKNTWVARAEELSDAIEQTEKEM